MLENYSRNIQIIAGELEKTLLRTREKGEVLDWQYLSNLNSYISISEEESFTPLEIEDLVKTFLPSSLNNEGIIKLILSSRKTRIRIFEQLESGKYLEN